MEGDVENIMSGWGKPWKTQGAGENKKPGAAERNHGVQELLHCLHLSKGMGVVQG